MQTKNNRTSLRARVKNWILDLKVRHIFGTALVIALALVLIWSLKS